MNSIGNTIKYLRKAKGVTQEEMAQSLGITYQSISKWENNITLPDITMLPGIATYFGISMDELFGFKLNVMTDKERFIDFMSKNNILCRGNFTLKNGGNSDYFINTENFMQIPAHLSTHRSAKSVRFLRTVFVRMIWSLTQSWDWLIMELGSQQQPLWLCIINMA